MSRIPQQKDFFRVQKWPLGAFKGSNRELCILLQFGDFETFWMNFFLPFDHLQILTFFFPLCFSSRCKICYFFFLVSQCPCDCCCSLVRLVGPSATLQASTANPPPPVRMVWWGMQAGWQDKQTSCCVLGGLFFLCFFSSQQFKPGSKTMTNRPTTLTLQCVSLYWI